MPIDHPLRRELHDEVHARPSLYFDAPAVVWHEAFLLAGFSESLPSSLLRLEAMRTRDGKSGIASTDLGMIKWEVHTEFVTLTHVVSWDQNGAELPQPEPLWTELLASMPGRRITAIEVLVGRPGGRNPRELLASDGDLIGSSVGGGDAQVWSSFRIGSNGSTRMLVINERLNDYRTGRMVRRLLEIETYRMMALLALPLSRDVFTGCAKFDAQLKEVMSGMGRGHQEALLRDLTKLATDVLDMSAGTRDRFSATTAYAELLFKRLRELREERIQGHQRIGVFIDRRFGPAVRSCEQASRRLESLSLQVARASELLRTSVQVDLEQQNARLLGAMERRVAIQTKLQEAVEGFSIIAISYYVLGILKLTLESAIELYEPIHRLKEILPALVPVVVILVWLSVRRVRLSLTSHSGSH